MRAQIDQYKIHVRSLTADSVSEQLVDLELILETEYQVTIGRRETGQLAEELRTPGNDTYSMSCIPILY